ncbi:MAG TPA: hypothetical protein VN814_06025, partial [Caulobacteraceae bacterium]|nr:hypothetical protein [Caulobacteraceae bacterium]
AFYGDKDSCTEANAAANIDYAIKIRVDITYQDTFNHPYHEMFCWMNLANSSVMQYCDKAKARKTPTDPPVHESSG